MKTLEINVPYQVAETLKGPVDKGCFASEAEAERLDLSEFVREHRLNLREPFQRADIAWALSLKKAVG